MKATTTEDTKMLEDETEDQCGICGDTEKVTIADERQSIDICATCGSDQ